MQKVVNYCQVGGVKNTVLLCCAGPVTQPVTFGEKEILEHSAVGLEIQNVGNHCVRAQNKTVLQKLSLHIWEKPQ